MAKAPKLPRTVRDASSRELDVTNEAVPRDEILRFGDTTDAIASDRQNSFVKLLALCQNPPLRESALRMERIAAIRAEIAAGTYRISATAIVEKLIEHMLTNRPPRTDPTE